MKISTRGRYAVRLMLDLAVNETDTYVTVKSIAERQEISSKYLEQIISVLNRAGYVKSIRGSQGGYKLSHPPADYTVGMILRTIEGSLAPVACLEDHPVQCYRSDKCVTLGVWKEVEEAISHVVDGITLADLVARQRIVDEQFKLENPASEAVI